MKQNPSRLKYKKNHKVSKNFFLLLDKKKFFPEYGIFALKALEAGKLTFRQIEAGRKSIRRNIRKIGRVFVKVFTYKSVTAKPLASRMGKGKGNHSFWISPIKAGQILFELGGGIPSHICYKALHRASFKIPFKTIIVSISY